jgi:hypothetical protein
MKCSGPWLSPIASILFVALFSPPTVVAGDEPRTVETAVQSADTCGVTTAQERPFTAPAPYPPTAPSTRFFWYGGEELWTMLQVDGTWKGLPRTTPTSANGPFSPASMFRLSVVGNSPPVIAGRF